MPEHRVSDADIDRWVAGGIITPEQGGRIRHDLDTHRPPGAITLQTVLYYGGGLLVLLAYGIFLGLQWEDLNEVGRLAIAFVSLAFFWGASAALLRSAQFKLPGELLQVVAVGAVPLAMFTLLDAAGWWPEDPGFRASDAAQGDYQNELAWARMALAAPAVAAAGAAFTWSRSPYVLVAGLVGVTSLAVDISLQVRGPGPNYELETSELSVIAALGATYVLAGVAARPITERDYSFWLYVAGIGALAFGLMPLTFPYDAAVGWGVLWMAAALAVVALSVALQERLLAVAGLAGIFAYLARLVFDVFESAIAALAMVVLGLIVLGVGILYQRYSEALFERGGGR